MIDLLDLSFVGKQGVDWDLIERLEALRDGINAIIDVVNDLPLLHRRTEREELAARLMVGIMAEPNMTIGQAIHMAFEAADAFLAEAQRQREAGK